MKELTLKQQQYICGGQPPAILLVISFLTGAAGYWAYEDLRMPERLPESLYRDKERYKIGDGLYSINEDDLYKYYLSDNH